MIGLLDDIDNLVGSAFTTAGDAIILFGDPLLKLEGSEFQVMQYGTPGTDAPDIDLRHEKNLQDLLVTLAGQKLLHSAHDVSDGGLFVTLAEKAIMDESRQLGFQVDLEDCGSGPYRVQEQLFSEAQGRVVGTIAPDAARAVIEEAIRHSVPVRVIGQVVPADASLAVDGHETLRFTTDELSAAYYDALENALHLNELL
jgi:phosphoribosylformylglycinamidine synthase